MPDGSIVLSGGSATDGIKQDVWRSTNKGANWTQMTTSAEWGKRTDHSSVAMPDGSIILTGGYISSGYYKNDTWRSVNNGSSWTSVNASSGWTKRYHHTSVVLPDESIVLMGGFDSIIGRRNDTWRSVNGGATWTLMNASSGWTARYEHTSVAMPDGSILLMGGSATDGLKNDMWRSNDCGRTWSRVDESAAWNARGWQTTVVLPDGSIVLMGGGYEGVNYNNDVWRLVPTGSSLQHPSHTYTVPGTYPVALQVYNTVGYNNIQKPAYITVTQPPVPNPNMLNGTIYYSGIEHAPIYVYLFNQTPAPGVMPFKTKNLTYFDSRIKYGFTAGNGTFWVMAYMDLNGNHTPDFNEPRGFAINKSFLNLPDPIQVTGNMTGLDVTLFEIQPRISLTLEKDFTVSTKNNTILAGTQDSRLRYQMRFFPTNQSLSDFVVGNMSFSLAAENISDVDYKPYAIWNSSAANWVFPSKFTIKSNNGLSVTADTTTHKDKTLNLSLSREVNRTVFSENGTQLLTANITFTSKEFLSAHCIIDTTHSTLAQTRFVPGSVSSNAPVDWIETYDQWILFIFNRTEIRTDVPYTLSVVTSVEPNGTPVEFMPRITAGQTFYFNSSPGAEAHVGVMPKILLPKTVSSASAASNVSGIWQYYTEDNMLAILEQVDQPVPPAPVLNGTIINQSATIFIGEQGLNVTHALNQAQGNPSIDGVPPLKSIGWWADGAEVSITSPTKTINLDGRYTSFTVEPADFVGYTGTWYVIRDDQTAVGEAFTVTDPRLDLRILDFTHTADVTGKSVPQNTRLGFGIATNMYPAVDDRYRSPINPATDGYITIKVKNASGSTWQSLYNNSASAGTLAGPNTLLANFVNIQPWAWGGNNTWSWQTSARDTSDQYAYPPGAYTASAESTLNHMKDNYKMAGADYTGKTVSPTYTLNLRVCGDFNGNNIVDIGDTARVAYMVVGLTPVDMAADFNGAGGVDAGDAAKIAWYIVGKVPAL
jgi:PKD repeat protein